MAGPNEQRTISREDLGLYHNVINGAIYKVDDIDDLYVPSTFFHALRSCIRTHTWLSVVVENVQTDKSFYERVPTLDLNQHITIAEDSATKDRTAKIEAALGAHLEASFPPDIPPWRIIVVPLAPRECFIAFAYSHAIGDGPTGKAFHRTFLHAFKDTANLSMPVSKLVEVPDEPLPPPFDTKQRLPISWSFLLGPLIATFLPSFIARLLGFQSHYSIDDGTWTGLNTNLEAKTAKSKIFLRTIPPATLTSVLNVSRNHNARLTGVFIGLIVRALSQALPDPKITNFLSVTPINMRKAAGISEDVTGNIVSGLSAQHPRDDTPIDKGFSEDFWTAAKSSTIRLSEISLTLQDQSIGLLRFLPSMRKWLLGSIGKRRDCSFEVSNVGVLDLNSLESRDEASSRARITELIFSQCGHVLGPPLAFNLGSVKGGALNYTVTWKVGALGLEGGEEEEEKVVTGVCARIEKELASMN